MEQSKRVRRRSGFLTGTVAAVLLAAPLALVAQGDRPQRGHDGSNSRQAASLPPPSNERQAPAPVERRPAPAGNMGAQMSANPNPQAFRNNRFAGAKGEHLNEWMRAHNNLSLAQQQEALSREPGFRELPPQTQQRMRDRLSQLSAMTPEQRQRTLEHAEAMERLNPAQRADVRSAMLQLGSLPPDQRKVVSRAFRELRGMPPEQRLPALNSQFRNLNEQQRFTLERLMQVEPMLPPPDGVANNPSPR